MISKKSIVAVSLIAITGFLFFNFAAPNAKAATVEELRAQIESLQRLIVQLQQQLTQIGGGETAPWCHTFNVNLRIGDGGDGNVLSGTGLEVNSLIKALSKEGFLNYEQVVQPGSAGTSLKATSFSEIVASAVVAFQQKYKSEVLTPWGLANGTGYVGNTTRAKLNKLYGCGMVAPVPTTPSITILSPNGGEQLVIGNTYDITWKSSGIDKVMFEISNGSEGWHLAYNVAANLGKYSWTVPEAVGVGSNYKINIWDPANASIADSSDSYFSIVSPGNKPFVVVSTPNGGEQWTVGQTERISWKSSGVNYVRIYVYTDDASLGSGSINYIYDGAINAAVGYYDWTIQQNQLPGSASLPRQYKMRIDGVNNTIVGSTVLASDHSDNYFTIALTSSITCTDSDTEKAGTGKNYYTKGIVQVGSSSFEDSCKYNPLTGKTDGLSEYFCDPTTYGKWNHITVKCSGGCVNGACLGTAISPICSDPDGSDIYTKGLANDEYGTGQGDCCVAGSGGGICVTESNYVKEGLCKSGTAIGQWTFTNQTYKCPSGCKDGACISATPSITVLSPNGEEQWVAGKTYDIKWQFSGTAGNVYISLDKWSPDASSVSGGNIISKVSATAGKYSWTIPQNQEEYSYYKVNIGLLDDTPMGAGGTADSSDNYFSIISASSVTCTDSDGGINYGVKGFVSILNYPQIGYHTDSNDYCNGNVLSEVYCNPSGSVNGIPGFSQIFYTCSNSCQDSACISTTPSVTVLSPNGGEQWETGETHFIKWASTGYDSGASIQIGLRDGRYDPNLANGEITIANTTNIGGFNWTIPSTIEAGSFFKIIVYVDGGGQEGKYDLSDNNFQITKAITKETLTLRPNGPGSECNIPNQSGCSACPNHYTCVDEAVGDGNTFVYYPGNTSTWKRDLYSLSDSVNLGIINKITVYRWVRCNNSYSKTSIRTHGTTYDSAFACSGTPVINNLPFGGQLYPVDWTMNPYTGQPWTWNEINDLEVGVSLLDGNAFNSPDWSDLTQVYVEVDYTPELGLGDAKDQLASISEAVSGLLEKINQMFNR